jgi:hypothetical protein
METLDQYHEELARKRKIRLQALAILRRCKDAGIPDGEMRIGIDLLKPILDEEFHNGKKGMAVNDLLTHIYKKADDLFKHNFIIIDGGNLYTRRRAGFALLFRMIACDRNGKFYSCQDVAHKLQTINSTAEMNRNDLADELKIYEILFLEEFRKEQLKVGFEIQWFFDEILTAREMAGKPTIFSFSNPVAGHALSEDNALSSINTYGQYMCMLSQLDMKPIPNTLRIKVKE